MTLKQLYETLGNQIDAVLSLEDISSNEYRLQMEKSDMIARLSKQMINDADVILRTDKLLAESRLSENATIVKMVKGND